MTRASRIAAFALGGLMVLGGSWLIVATGMGWPMLAGGALIVIGTAFDGAYRGRASRLGATRARWRDTGEREVDGESGEVVVVWYDPVSGARAYEPVGRAPSQQA